MRGKVFFCVAFAALAALGGKYSSPGSVRLTVEVLENQTAIVSVSKPGHPAQELARGRFQDLSFEPSQSLQHVNLTLDSGQPMAVVSSIEGETFFLLPYHLDSASLLEWHVFGRGKETFTLLAIEFSDATGGLYLSRSSDNKTLRLADQYFPLFSRPPSFEEGTDRLIFSDFGLQFSLKNFDSENGAKREGGLLEPFASRYPTSWEETLAGIELPLAKLNDQRFEPGRDFTVIFHPLWQKLGPGLRATDKRGGFQSYLDNLGFLVNTMKSAGDALTREAAQAAFRLLVPQVRDLSGITSLEQPLGVPDYEKVYLRKLKGRCSSSLGGLTGPGTE